MDDNAIYVGSKELSKILKKYFRVNENLRLNSLRAKYSNVCIVCIYFTMIVYFLSFNPLLPGVAFLYLLKTLENL